MGAEIPDNFCPQCLCPGCVEVSRKLWEIRQRQLEEAEERAAVLRERQEREEERQAELFQQAAMIWMLTNHAADAGEVKEIINVIAEALDISTSMANARRNIYVTELNRRLGNAGYPQFKPPGTRGSEEPDWCPECGGMMTKGRRCRRRLCR